MPPKNAESVEEADTLPAIACRGPVSEPSVNVPAVKVPKFAVVPKRFVEDATEEKKEVVVAFVPVAFPKTKLPVRVVEERAAPVPKIREPLPDSSVTMACSSAEVSISVVASPPPLPEMHVPFKEKHPPVRAMPLLNVDVAVVEVAEKTDAENPPEKLEVAVLVFVTAPVRVPPARGR